MLRARQQLPSAIIATGAHRQRLGVLAFFALIAALLTAPAWADDNRVHGWEIFASPVARATPPAAAAPGRDTLPDLPWAKVYVPRTYDPQRPAPIALLLHGSGDRGGTMIDAFASLAEKEGVILLAPDSQRYTWDIMVKAAGLKGATRVPNWGADVPRIDEALQAAFDRYAIDPKRIALIGFSDGAGYGLSLGANNARLFSSVIAFSPGLLMRVDGVGRGRVFIAHGDHDRVLPLAPSRDIFAPVLVGLGFNVTLRIFDGRHEMPDWLRAEAFDWWLHPHRHADAPATAR
jgi:predicted esterase